jgi:choline dehydrogenase-like flavoprotein
LAATDTHHSSGIVNLAPGINRFGLPKMEVRFTTSELTRAGAYRCLSKMRTVLEIMGARDIRTDIGIPNGTYHFAGTKRMTKDPAEGVVDEHLAIHEMDNVYVCSNAVLPTISAINPTLTLAALALRLGDHLCS